VALAPPARQGRPWWCAPAWDLLVYAHNRHDPFSIHHVALAVGAGRMVEAAAPGVPVRITRIRRAGVVAAARPAPHP